jgi:SAM-dependent methyltransferase
VSEHEVDLIVSRLRDELGANTEIDGDGSVWAARAQAERFWAVTADRPFLYKTGIWGRLRGTFLVPAKVVLRKLMRWYIEPALSQQRDFNASILRAVTYLSEQVDRSASMPREADGVVPDYAAFEERMRGTSDVIRARQAPYVDDLRHAAPVLDVGCGRGEFLELLREAGIKSIGIDIDPDMVEICRQKGLDAKRADALAHLEGLENGSLGGIFCAHVVEHVAPDDLYRLLELAAAKLRPGGTLIAETPNPRALFALSMFFADPTHQRPVDPETLAFLGRQAGFDRVEIRFLNEPPAEHRLQPVSLPDDASRAALASNTDLLNEVVFGPQDFALVAHA